MTQKIDPFTVEVIEHMSPTEWKSSLQIADGIGESWKKQGRRDFMVAFFSIFTSDAEDIVRKPSLGSLHVVFAELEREKWIEARWRPEPPEASCKARWTSPARAKAHRARPSH